MQPRGAQSPSLAATPHSVPRAAVHPQARLIYFCLLLCPGAYFIHLCFQPGIYVCSPRIISCPVLITLPFSPRDSGFLEGRSFPLSSCSTCNESPETAARNFSLLRPDVSPADFFSTPFRAGPAITLGKQAEASQQQRRLSSDQQETTGHRQTN